MAKKLWMGTMYGAGKTRMADRKRLMRDQQKGRTNYTQKGWRGRKG